MNHAVEYFHSLVEHDFSIDQYEVSFNEGKYNITITFIDDGKSPMSYYMCMMYQKKMEKCLKGLIKPENMKISVVLPIKLLKENLEGHYARINRLLRVTPPTNDKQG